VIPGGTGVPVVLQPILKLLVVPNGGTGGTTMEDCRSAWTALGALVPPVSTTCSRQFLWSTTGPTRPPKKLSRGMKMELRIMTAP